MSPRWRRWLCRHPALAITAWSVFWLCISAALGELENYLINKNIIPYLGHVDFVLLALTVLGIAASSFTVGITLGRSGLPVSRALKGLKYTPLAVVIVLGIISICEIIKDGRSSTLARPDELGIGAGVVFLGLIVSQLLGWGSAALVVRRRLRSGKWETTAIVEGALTKPSLWQWLAVHPVWTMNLLAAGTATVAVLAVIIMQQIAEKTNWPNERWLKGLLLLGLLAWGLLGTLYAATMGVILARRGKSTQRVLLSAFWFPVTFGLPLLLLWACEYGIGKAQGHSMTAMLMWAGLFAWYVGIICYLVGQFLGWLVSAIYGWFVRRRRAKSAPPMAS